MTNAPASRKTHVIRIFGTNRAGERIDDIWVDVERIDETKSEGAGDTDGQTAFGANTSKTGLGRNHQKTVRKFKWMDDPTADDYNPDGNPSRVIEKIKVCDPESEDVDDPDEYVEIDVIKEVKAVASDNNYQRFVEKQLNEEINSSREVEVRKIVHYDTNIDDAAQAAADADPSLKAYVVSSEEYIKDESSKDEDQYVEHEIITKIFSRGNSPLRSGDDAQKRVMKLKNQYLIDESETPSGTVIGATGINPPYRLDPYQNIVNVNFATLKQTWLLSTSMKIVDGGDTAHGDPPWTTTTGQDGSYGNYMQGASGSGFTVITKGGIAYGKITLASGVKRGVFMWADLEGWNSDGGSSGEVKMGIVQNGIIQWSTVYTAPPSTLGGSYVAAVSYANEKFFVTYRIWSSESMSTFVAVTSNGTSWTTAATCNGGNNVVYLEDEELYAMAGKEFFDGGDPEGTEFVDTLTWAISTNGTSWSTGKSSSATSGPGGAIYLGPTNIAAGNGVFVTASSTKHTFTNTAGGEPQDGQYVLQKSAVAVSTNGQTWTTISLPNGVVAGGPQRHEIGDISSAGLAVVFVKDKNLDMGDPTITHEDNPESNERTGYFIATDYAGFASGITISNVYTSVDGFSWGAIMSGQGNTDDGSCAPLHFSLTAIAKDVDETDITYF
jgi:hypothetical protein